MPIYQGNNNISNIDVGSNTIGRAYLGDNIVYGYEPLPDNAEAFWDFTRYDAGTKTVIDLSGNQNDLVFDIATPASSSLTKTGGGLRIQSSNGILAMPTASVNIPTLEINDPEVTVIQIFQSADIRQASSYNGWWRLGNSNNTKGEIMCNADFNTFSSGKISVGNIITNSAFNETLYTFYKTAPINPPDYWLAAGYPTTSLSGSLSTLAYQRKQTSTYVQDVTNNIGMYVKNIIKQDGTDTITNLTSTGFGPFANNFLQAANELYPTTREFNLNFSNQCNFFIGDVGLTGNTAGPIDMTLTCFAVYKRILTQAEIESVMAYFRRQTTGYVI